MSYVYVACMSLNYISGAAGDVKKLKSPKVVNSLESFEDKLARTDPEFLEFLKNEKSDLLDFDSGELSAESDDSTAEVEEKSNEKPKKNKKLTVMHNYILICM